MIVVAKRFLVLNGARDRELASVSKAEETQASLDGH